MNDAKTLAAPNLIAANDMLKVNGLKLNHQSKKIYQQRQYQVRDGL